MVFVLEKKSAWDVLDHKEIEHFSEEYKDFLSKVKTEREAVEYIVNKAEKKGFKNLDEIDTLKHGDKVYFTFKNKVVILGIIGKKPLEDGIRIIGSHIDAPRLDLKPVPIYEDEQSNTAVLKTQYYGGIKKYQWVNIPLALHGVVVLKDGTAKKIVIGEDSKDPVLVIPDLLPHLARKVQGDRKGFDIIKGEELRIILGHTKEKSDGKEKKNLLKKRILKILEEKYGISEEDFISADLEVVPAVIPRDAGLDQSFIAAYGQDDRSSVYTSLKAILDAEEKHIEYTSIAVFIDKEETGSDGNTGAKSQILEFFINELLEKSETSKKPVSPYTVLKLLMKSKAISADVNAAINPMYKDVHDIENAGKIGYGIILSKYSGHGGKYSCNDAHAEYVAWIRKILDEKNIPWQSGLLGKVDEGGGGTIAMYFAQRGMDIIDMGIGLIGMHSPYELSSKADLYSAYLAYKSFFEAN